MNITMSEVATLVGLPPGARRAAVTGRLASLCQAEQSQRLTRLEASMNERSASHSAAPARASVPGDDLGTGWFRSRSPLNGELLDATGRAA